MNDQGQLPDQIRLTGISAIGYHGVLDHERRDGQTFVVDLTVELSTRRAAATDDLEHTLDYGVLAEQVVSVLRGEPAALIETVAERIAATVLAHSQASGVEVTVHKPQAPIAVPFSDVEVRVRRDRGQLPAAEPVRVDAQPWSPQGVGAEPAGVSQSADGVGGFAAVVPLVAAPLAAASVVPAPVTAASVAAEPPGIPPVESLFPPVFPVAESTDDLDTRSQAPDDSAANLAATAMMATVGLDGVEDAAPEHAGDDEGLAEALSPDDQLDVATDEPTEVILALGANLGMAQQTLRDAVAELAEVPGLEVVAVSALARTAAVGGPEQPDYLNAVVIVTCTLAPRELLRVTAELELKHGRVREEQWGPRTLDIDIIAFGVLSVVTDDLELPHPRAHERAFVLQPWAQLQPDAVLHGLGGGPVAQLAATAPDRDGVRWLALDWLTSPLPGQPVGAESEPELAPVAVPEPQVKPISPVPPFPRFGPDGGLLDGELSAEPPSP